MIDNLKLLELMSARMFHDLAGPVGAVNNSLDFLEEESPSLREKALQIIKSSSAESILRLKFFRKAYGSANDKMLSLESLRSTIDEFLEKTKIKITWIEADILEIDSSIAKIIMNFTIIAAASIIYGGFLEISCSNRELKIKFIASNLILSDETMYILKGELDNITLSSSNIQIYFTHMLIKDINYKIKIDKNTSETIFTFK